MNATEEVLQLRIKRRLAAVSPLRRSVEIDIHHRLVEDLGIPRSLRDVLAPGLTSVVRKFSPSEVVTPADCSSLFTVSDVVALVRHKAGLGG